MAIIPFADLACTDAIMKAFKKCKMHGVLGRVTSLDRGFPLVNTADAELRAELSTVIKKSEDSIVAVGDWVVLDHPKNHEKAIIQKILPRQTEIARIKRVGRENQIRRHVLAANVDKVFICQALGSNGFDERLAQRQIAAIYGCGAKPIFVFTKADRVSEDCICLQKEQLHEVFPELEIVVVSSKENKGIDDVRRLCAPNTTSLLLGESGVGKSSLVNGLFGTSERETGAVREADDKGRHTTVARRLLKIPDAGLMIDAPGLRTLQIIDLEASLRATFPDIYQWASHCKFSDCTHTHEPDCAVRIHISPARLKAYFYLSSK